MRGLTVATAAMLAAASPVWAMQQPPPARPQQPCTAVQPYQGPPPHAAPAAADFPAAGRFASTPFAAARVQALDAALTQLAGNPNIRSLAVAVWRPGGGHWSARREAAGVEAKPLHWWGSAGKLTTSISAMQMIEEGRLSLDAPATTWRQDVPNGSLITVGSLLNHTNGLFSANEAPEAQADPRHRPVEEWLTIAGRNGPFFCPGGGWRYTNTGYILLGSIIEAVEGRPYAEAATARTFGRLGVADARILTPGESLADVQPLAAPPGAPPFDPSWIGPSGGVVATPTAMIRLLHGALGGELLQPATAQSMLAEPYQMFNAPMWYGRGMMLFDMPTQQGDKLYWLGHNGGGPGAMGVVLWSPRERAYVAVAITGQASPEMAANMLLKALGAPA